MQNKRITDAKLQLADGNMHYLSLGRGPAIVLLHSMASSVRSWSRVIKPLARSHSVYALDTMGQGDSDKPPRDYAIEDYAASVAGFMKTRDLPSAALVGNSVGAVIAVQLAAANPEMVERLVLVGCPCRETEQERREAGLMSRAQYDDKGMPLPRSLEDLKQHYARVSPQLQAIVNQDRAKAGAWAWKCGVALGRFDIVPALRKVRAPALLVFGEKDLLRGKEQALQGHVPASRLVIIPDAGHLPQVDNPQAFLRAVQAFLQ